MLSGYCVQAAAYTVAPTFKWSNLRNTFTNNVCYLFNLVYGKTEKYVYLNGM